MIRNRKEAEKHQVKLKAQPVMLTIFWDAKDPILWDYFKGQNIINNRCNINMLGNVLKQLYL